MGPTHGTDSINILMLRGRPARDSVVKQVPLVGLSSQSML